MCLYLFQRYLCFCAQKNWTLVDQTTFIVLPFPSIISLHFILGTQASIVPTLWNRIGILVISKICVCICSKTCVCICFKDMFVFVIGPESPVSPEMLQLPSEFVKSNFRVTLPLPLPLLLSSEWTHSEGGHPPTMSRNTQFLLGGNPKYKMLYLFLLSSEWTRTN